MIHFRKGKRIPCFDYKVNIPIRVRLYSGELLTGQVEVPEFTNSYGEVPEDMEVRVNFISDWHCQPQTAKDFLSYLRKDVSPLIREALLASASKLYNVGLAPPPPPKKGPFVLHAMLRRGEEREMAR